MLRRNKKRDEAPALSNVGSSPAPSPTVSTFPFRTSSPSQIDGSISISGSSGIEMQRSGSGSQMPPLPSSFPPLTKSATSGSTNSNSINGMYQSAANSSLYMQGSAPNSSSSNVAGNGSSRNVSHRAREQAQSQAQQQQQSYLPHTQSQTHLLQQQQQQHQQQQQQQNYYRHRQRTSDAGLPEGNMAPPSSGRANKNVQYQGMSFPASQSVDTIGSSYPANAHQYAGHAHKQQQQQQHHQQQHHQSQQGSQGGSAQSGPNVVGRSQSAFNFLLSKAKAPFSSSSGSSNNQPMSNPAMNASASLSSLFSTSASNAPLDEQQHHHTAPRADSLSTRSRAASESSNNLFLGASSFDRALPMSDSTNSGRARPIPQTRHRPSFGDEGQIASSPTKRGFFSRERKVSTTSSGKGERGNVFGNAARQAFSHSPLGRGSASPRQDSGSSTNVMPLQFSKSHTDLHGRPDFPSPASITIDLPRSPPMNTFGLLGNGGHSPSTTTDSKLLRSPNPHAGFSRSVDDLSHSRTPTTVSPGALSNPSSESFVNWGELGVASADRGRASDIGALKPDGRRNANERGPSAQSSGLGVTNLTSQTANSISSTTSSNWSSSLNSYNQADGNTFDSAKHMRKSSRTQAQSREAASSLHASSTSSLRDVERPVLGPGVLYEGLLNRNTNVSMSIHQLTGKEKEKDITKGWKPYRVTLRDGKLYFYKPSSSVADEVKTLFPTTIVAWSANATGAGNDASSGQLSSSQTSLLSNSASTSGLSVDDVKRNKLGTRDLLAATSSSSNQNLDPRFVPRRSAVKDSRLSAIMDSTEPDNTDLAHVDSEHLPSVIDWELPDRHADLILDASKTEPLTWAARVQGGSADALAHEYVYATQCTDRPSADESLSMLSNILSILRQSTTPPQGFLSALRKWSHSALNASEADGAAGARDEASAFAQSLYARLTQVVRSDILTSVDEQSKSSVAYALETLRREFPLAKSEENLNLTVPRNGGAGSSPLMGGVNQLLVPPTQHGASPVSEKESRRMTAFFRGAVRPIGGLMTSSSSNNTHNEAVPPRSFNELLTSITTQKPTTVLPCGASRVSVWRNGQRSFVFNLSPFDGGHLLLQAHNATELAEWCRAIETASKEYASSVQPSADSSKKEKGGAGSGPLSGQKSAKDTPTIALYGTDVKILAGIEGQSVPRALNRMLEEVEKRGLREQGLYRISGAKSAIEGLKTAFSSQSPDSVNLSYGEFSDVHTIAGAIKQWFRDLPEPVIPFASYHALIDAERMESEEDRLYAFRDIIWEFPRVHFDLLKRISEHLSMVCDEGQHNLMAPHNIGLVFGTSLLNPPPGPASVAESFGNIGKAAHIVKIIVTMYEWLFEPEPEPEPEAETEQEAEQEEEVESGQEPERGSDVEAVVEQGQIQKQVSGQEQEAEQHEVERELPSVQEGAQVRVGVDDSDVQEKSSISNDTTGAPTEKADVARENVKDEEDAAGHADTASAVSDEGNKQKDALSGKTSTNELAVENSEKASQDPHVFDLEEVLQEEEDETRTTIDTPRPSNDVFDHSQAPPWLDHPLNADEGTIDSHASDSSILRAVMGAHPMLSSNDPAESTASKTLESETTAMFTADEGASNDDGVTESPDPRSRANSTPQVFLDVDEEPATAPLTKTIPAQQRLDLSKAHERVAESVYLDATDAMAVLQNPFERRDSADAKLTLAAQQAKEPATKALLVPHEEQENVPQA